VGLERGVGSQGGNGGEILLGCGHGGKRVEGPCTTTTTLPINITNGHELITACQKRWGIIGG
jgi:hypothetical protein